VKLNELRQEELIESKAELKALLIQHSQPGALKWLIDVPRPFLKTCIPKEDFSAFALPLWDACPSSCSHMPFLQSNKRSK
jgi:hypothetical protein